MKTRAVTTSATLGRSGGAVAASDFALRKAAVHAISLSMGKHLGRFAHSEREEIERFLSLAHPQQPLLVAGPSGNGEDCIVRQVLAKCAPGTTRVVVVSDKSDSVKELYIRLRDSLQAVNTFKLPGVKLRDMQTYLRNHHIETKLQKNLILIVENFDNVLNESEGRVEPVLSRFLQFFTTLMRQSRRFKMIVKLESDVRRDRLFRLFEDPSIARSYAVTFRTIPAATQLLEMGVNLASKSIYANANASSTLVAPRVLEMVARKAIRNGASDMRLALDLLIRAAKLTEERATPDDPLFISMGDVMKAST